MREEVVVLAQDLIRENTVNPPGNEVVAACVIKSFLDDHGIQYKTYEAFDKRQNIVAHIKGKGLAPPLLLYGHLDVVSCEKQNWTVDPFSGEIRDGYLWGRGALDMKGGVAMLTHAFSAFSNAVTPPGDLILAIVADEESGGQAGAKYLVESHSDLFLNVKHAIGEFGGFTLNVLGKTFMPIQ